MDIYSLFHAPKSAPKAISPPICPQILPPLAIGRFNVEPGTKTLLLSERDELLQLDHVFWNYAHGWWISLHLLMPVSNRWCQQDDNVTLAGPASYLHRWRPAYIHISNWTLLVKTVTWLELEYLSPSTVSKKTYENFFVGLWKMLTQRYIIWRNIGLWEN